MRLLLAALLVTASLPLLTPTAAACHAWPPDPATQREWNPFGEPPRDNHGGTVDVHYSDCGSDPGLWVCVHEAGITRCAGSDF